MIIQKSIPLNTPKNDLLETIQQFWESRNFVFSHRSETELIGSRGNLTGNLLSFDMSQLKTTLQVHVESESIVHCELDIDTRFQTITEWNHAYWTLELKTLESVLEGNGHLPSEWQAYHHNVQKKNIMWSFKMTVVAVLIIAIFRFAIDFFK